LYYKSKLVYVWNSNRGQIFEFWGHLKEVNSLFLYDKTYVISGSLDKTIRVWDLENFSFVFRADLNVVPRYLDFNNEREFIAIDEKNLIIWDFNLYKSPFVKLKCAFLFFYFWVTIITIRSLFIDWFFYFAFL
jgi:WD40 repeat protein